ncbi:CGGC domain-containing protein [Fusobacterium sp. THCT13E1]
MEKTKLIVIIQCEIAKRRCSGFYCMDSFYKRNRAFSIYSKEENIQYMMFECGGCCGKEILSLLGHLSRKLKEEDIIKKEETVIHLASCMVTDNHHYDRCPHIDYIKNIIKKQGYRNVIEGTLLAKVSEKKRELGIYKKY